MCTSQDSASGIGISILDQRSQKLASQMAMIHINIQIPPAKCWDVQLDILPHLCALLHEKSSFSTTRGATTAPRPWSGTARPWVKCERTLKRDGTSPWWARSRPPISTTVRLHAQNTVEPRQSAQRAHDSDLCALRACFFPLAGAPRDDRAQRARSRAKAFMLQAPYTRLSEMRCTLRPGTRS